MALNRIIVIGASTGGVDAFCTLVKDLPSDLPAPVFIVQHSGRKSILAEVLRGCQGDGSVSVPQDGEMIESGRIYVAVPDHHLVLEGDRIRLAKGPRENLHRPSVDVLFRTAAQSYRNKVIGVVLTGHLEDGASGLFAIKSRGGVAVVQDPADALASEMPRNATRAVTVDHCLPLVEIGPLLVQLAHQSVPDERVVGLREEDADPLKEREIAMSDDVHPGFVCPECHGPLIAYEETKSKRFRCRIGHRYSLEGLSEAHAETLERGLWIAVRILEDRAAIQRLRAEKFAADGDHDHRETLLEVAAQAEADASRLREIAQRG